MKQLRKHACIYTYLSICSHSYFAFMYAYSHTYMLKHLHVCKPIYMHVYMYSYIYTHIHTYITLERKHEHIIACICTDMHTYLKTNIHILKNQAYILITININKNIFIQSRKHTSLHANMPTCTHLIGK